METTSPKIILRWTQIEDHHKAVADLYCGGCTGKATLINSKGSEGILLTPYCLIQSGESIKITFSNGQRAKRCELLCHDGRLALVRTWVPKGLNAAKLATKTIKGKQKVQIASFKGRGSLSNFTRVFETTVESSQEIGAIYNEPLVLTVGIGNPIFRGKEVIDVVLAPKQDGKELGATEQETEKYTSNIYKALGTFTSRKN